MGSDTRKTVVLGTGITVPFASHGNDDALPVVLLHAWGESSGVFDRLLPYLPPWIRALAFDQRGHGGASKPRTGYQLADASDDVCAFLDALDIPSAVLLGSSSGGYIAQKVAATAPDRVLALILVGAPRSLQGRPSFADEVDALTDPVDADWVRDSLAWYPLSNPVPAWYLEDRVQDSVCMPAHALQLSLTGLIGARPPSDGGRIRCPTLLIRGADDELIPLADHEALAAGIPGSRLLTYRQTGHLVLWERPEDVASDALAFLSRFRTSSGEATS